MLRRMRTDWLSSLALSCFVSTCATLATAEEPRDSLDAMRRMIMQQTQREYWLGIGCQRPSKALRSHLGLTTGEGLVVHHIVPDGPADQAGIERFDVILKFGSTEVGRIQELSEAIEEQQGEITEVMLIRAGRRQSLTVSPNKRPEHRTPWTNNTDAEQVFRWLEKSYRDTVQDFDEAVDGSWDEDTLRFRFIQPGPVLKEELDRVGIRLPKDLKVVVTNPDNGPARILIEKDGESWQLSTDDVGWEELPEDVRRYVEWFVGDNHRDEAATSERSASLDEPLDAEKLPPIEGDDVQTRHGIKQQLETVEEQLHQLREDFQRLLETQDKAPGTGDAEH